MVSQLALRTVLFAFATTVLTAAAPALAEDSPENEQTRYREAHRAISRKDWVAARDLLLPLWADSPTYDVASSLALVEYQLGDYPMAARHLAFALEHVAPVEKPETVQRMRSGMLELRGRVGGLRLTANAPTAVVSLNGQVVAASLLGRELFVAPGRHTIEARAAGVAPARQVLDVMPGQTYTVELDLRPAVTPAGSAPARLAEPSALQSDRPEERAWWPVVIGGALTATGLGLAVGFGVAANDAESEWRSRQAGISPSGCLERATSLECVRLRGAIERQHSAATWANVGVGVSALSVAATAAYLLLWPSQPPRVAPALAVNAHSAELGLSGSF
ncbi:MAG: hypothetical protein EOO73_24500 [Myxococcales bacterium]|nr:MAG: hypothetical protein EOO73_24500 [Myxococcales bacterium]